MLAEEDSSWRRRCCAHEDAETRSEQPRPGTTTSFVVALLVLLAVWRHLVAADQTKVEAREQISLVAIVTVISIIIIITVIVVCCRTLNSNLSSPSFSPSLTQPIGGIIINPHLMVHYYHRVCDGDGSSSNPALNEWIVELAPHCN